MSVIGGSAERTIACCGGLRRRLECAADAGPVGSSCRSARYKRTRRRTAGKPRTARRTRRTHSRPARGSGYADRSLGFLPLTGHFRMPTSLSSPVSRSTRWPARAYAAQPPTPVKRRKPSSSTCVTIGPISSVWPDDRQRRRTQRGAGTRTTAEPTTSIETSSLKARPACANTARRLAAERRGHRAGPLLPRRECASQTSTVW